MGGHQTVSLKVGDWLYRHCFPLYNVAYRRFKRRKDHRELELLAARIRPGDRVLDIGSNIGFYANVLSSLVGPDGRVYCFEPERTNYGHLVRNTSSRGNVTLFNLAVSDREGSLTVYRSTLLNVDHRTYPIEEFESTEAVRATTIDALVEQGVLDRVQFIKIDIQGYELAAFKGMRRLLGAAPSLGILCEFWPYGMKQAGVSPVELYDFFAGLRYRIGVIGEEAVTPVGRDYFAQAREKPFEFTPNLLIEKEA